MKDDLKRVPKKNKKGDCFQKALHLFFEDPKDSVLCHGIVTGQGPIAGIKYNHAWVEKDGMAIDKTINKEFPVSVYYYLGKIEIVRKYKLDDVTKNMDKYGTYGPWDKELWRYP